LLGVDFEAMPIHRLYRTSDLLVKHRAKIEDAVFSRVQDLFGLETTVTLYDLTNTYFHGTAAANPKAQRGRSKEKRADCPLVTLGLVLDGSGFVQRSRMFAGNVVEGQTLQAMLKGLVAPQGALVIMDAGIATEANVAWLREQNYRYLVVSRERGRRFDPDQATDILTASNETVRLQRVEDADTKEVRLYCHSAGRDAKETAITARFVTRFEAALTRMAASVAKAVAASLEKPEDETPAKPEGEAPTKARAKANKKAKPKTDKRPAVATIQQRIGRLKANSRGVGQHYEITVTADATATKVVAMTWMKTPVDGSMLTHPGVYCLRTNETSWSAEKLWRTYMTLTDLEAVFRGLKSELGLRPVFHQTEDRAAGHLFITVLAYQLVQVLRRKLKAAGEHLSWSGLREILSVQQRVTATFRQRDGRALHVRKATVAEPALRRIYEALAIDPSPGGTRKHVV